MNLVEHLPPNIIKGEPFTFDKGYLSNWYRFAQLVLSLPPFCGGEIDVGMKFEFGCCEGSPFDGAHTKMIISMDHTTWKLFMLKKGMHHLYVKWFLLLHEFEFEVHAKGGTC